MGISGEQPKAKWWRIWAVSYAAWATTAAFSTVQATLLRRSTGQPPIDGIWLASLAFNLWLWATMTPAMVWLARRFPLSGRRLAPHAALHVLLAFGFAVLSTAIEHAVRPWIGAHPERPFAARFFGSAFIDVGSYIVVVAITHASDYYRLFNERTLRAAALEAELAKAQLAALQMQLRPHFLFNALHTVGSLIRTGQDQTALRMLAGLGDLLRALLQSDGAAEVPLRQELDLLYRYLRIEQVRFQDRLVTHVLAEPDTLDALVPSLILQPLVENALRHGIGACEGQGELEIRAVRQGKSLCLEVRDSGTGPSDMDTLGIGITNTRARLQRLYGDHQKFKLIHNTNGGALARISIPFHREATEAS